MQTNTLFCEPSPHVSASMHHDGAVFFHAEHGQLFTTNRAGADIWRGLEQHLSGERIAEDLSHRYQLPLEAARTHTSHFIAQLVARQLVDRRLA
jgi:hypothetical protein